MNLHPRPCLIDLVAKGGEKDKQQEAAVKVHRIRITLTSRHVKNVEKGLHRWLNESHPGSLLRFDCTCKGEGSQSQRTCSSSYQGLEDHHPKDSKW